MTGLRLRRAKLLRRQSHVEERAARRQASEPVGPPPPPPPPTGPPLRKHHSYPQFAPRNRRIRGLAPASSAAAPAPAPALAVEQQLGSLLIRAVTAADRPAPPTPRASHTPAVRSGPPLSCNFCWNTVDECGRILRRKTQYHCPECRINLCIVPCFHEYHEAETEVPTPR